MRKNSEYWYFRFTENFFRDEEIRNMKHLPMIGYQFIVIYLELCALSLRTNGYIKVKKQAIAQGYAIDLAKDIGEDAEITAQAISYYITQGMIEIIEDVDQVNIFVPHVKYNTGKSSKAADYRRAWELDRGNKGEFMMIDSKENERMYKQLQESTERIENCKTYGSFQRVRITDNEYHSLFKDYQNAQWLIDKLDRYKAMKDREYKNDYSALLEIADKKGIKR